jgi:FAD/FMN-containing dehydrogenase
MGGQTAFGRRDARFILNVVGMWPEPSRDEVHIGWVRSFWDAVVPLAGSGAYLNFLGDEGTDRVRAAYGPETYDRLADLKARYDPGNVFRLNQNIQPRQVR